MLHVKPDAVARCGGFLNALTDAATDLVHEIVVRQVRWSPSDIPDRLIVHKAPHLDEYMAEMLFRSTLTGDDRHRDFREVALLADDDSSARVQWPSAAVFGIGADKPSGQYAQYLFDEHRKDGSRDDDDSCTEIVAKKCFNGVPSVLRRLVAEVTAIDSRGDAHELHLNNLIKTIHLVQYHLGQHSSGRSMSGKLSDTWKRAVVDALIAAVLYCLQYNIDITEKSRVEQTMKRMFDRIDQTLPYGQREHYAKAFSTLWDNVNDVEGMLKKQISIDGQALPQLLLAPFMAVAAEEAWGAEIAYFLMLHFWEAEILKNIHFIRTRELLEKSFADPRHLKTIYKPNCSVGGLVLHERSFFGKFQGSDQSARYPSFVWIVYCRHNNFVLQPHKAIGNFIGKKNFGIGITFCENTKETNKVLFKGRHLPHDYWSAVVDRIQAAEPGLWSRPNPTATFLLNGNAAHREVPLSSLTLGRLARICREVRVNS